MATYYFLPYQAKCVDLMTAGSAPAGGGNAGRGEALGLTTGGGRRCRQGQGQAKAGTAPAVPSALGVLTYL
jgi:hypothetical protein